MTKKIIQLNLIDIVYDQGTQRRKVDPQVVEEYANLMAEGTVFPPPDVWFDGQRHVLSQGFHRVFAARKNGAETIPVFLHKGTLDDAILHSFEGMRNGKEFSKEDIDRNIIALATDARFEKLGLTHQQIAEKVGKPRRYVSKVIEKHEKPIIEPDMSDMGQSAQTGTAESTISETNEQEVDSEDEEVCPRPYVKLVKNEPPLKDANKKLVPEHLRSVFKRASVIRKFQAEIDDLKKRVFAAVDSDPNLWAYFNTNHADTNFKNLRRDFEFTVPMYVCPYCAGQQSANCKSCNGCGFMTKSHWRSVPLELK